MKIKLKIIVWSRIALNNENIMFASSMQKKGCKEFILKIENK
jgi:hypothetical protein